MTPDVASRSADGWYVLKYDTARAAAHYITWLQVGHQR
jgi:hypothetical protein